MSAHKNSPDVISFGNFGTRIHPLWTWGFEQDGTVFGLGIFTTGPTANFIGQRLLLRDAVYNCRAPFLPDGFFVNLNGGPVEQIVNARETRTL